MERVGKAYPVRDQGYKRLVLKTEKGEISGLRGLQLFQLFLGTDWKVKIMEPKLQKVH